VASAAVATGRARPPTPVALRRCGLLATVLALMALVAAVLVVHMAAGAAVATTMFLAAVAALAAGTSSETRGVGTEKISELL